MINIKKKKKYTPKNEAGALTLMLITYAKYVIEMINLGVGGTIHACNAVNDFILHTL